MPKMEFKCNAKASLFAYPPPLESEKKKDNEKVEAAVLSISNKKKLSKMHEKPKEKEEKMEVDIAEEKHEKQPSKVAQEYKPVKPITQGGIIMVRDRRPDEAVELVEQVTAGGTTTTDPSAPEKEPHSTFMIDLNDL